MRRDNKGLDPEDDYVLGELGGMCSGLGRSGAVKEAGAGAAEESFFWLVLSPCLPP